jgi:hypothetical protein
LRVLFGLRQSARVTPQKIIDEPEQKSYLIEVIGNLTIHGFNQITIRNRHLAERLV